MGKSKRFAKPWQDRILQYDKTEIVGLFAKTADHATKMKQVLTEANEYLDGNTLNKIGHKSVLHQKIKAACKTNLLPSEISSLERIALGEDRGYANTPEIGRLLGEGLIEPDDMGLRLLITSDGQQVLAEISQLAKQELEEAKTPEEKKDNQDQEQDNQMSSNFNCPN